MTGRAKAALCGNRARDPSTGKAFSGPFAKACEREPGHEGPHRIGPSGELGSVIEWTDDKLGWVAFNQKAKNMAKKQPATSLVAHHRRKQATARAEKKRSAELRAKPPQPSRFCNAPEREGQSCGHACELAPGHDGDHASGPTTWPRAVEGDGFKQYGFVLQVSDGGVMCHDGEFRPLSNPVSALDHEHRPHVFATKQRAGSQAHWVERATSTVPYFVDGSGHHARVETTAAAEQRKADNVKSKNTTPKADAKSDPRCASKQQNHRCDLPTAHDGAHLARVKSADGFSVKTWNASANNSWPCCTVKASTKVTIQCWRPDEHNGGHRALVGRSSGGIELAIWQGDAAPKVSTVKLHDAAAQLLASKLDRGGRPAAVEPPAPPPDPRPRPMTLDDEPEDPVADAAAIAAMDEEDSQEFDAVWKALEDEGACDAFGGVQYERISKLWRQRGGDIASLIRREANAGPNEASEPDADEDDANDARWACEAIFVGDDGREHKCEARNKHNGPHYAFCRVLNRTVNAASGGGSARPRAGTSSESAHIQTGRASGLEHPPARLFGYRRHAAGALWSFADLQGDDFDKVVANLMERDAAAREAGVGDDQALISAITLVEVTNEQGRLEKFILDGWNRARCCESAGVRPRFTMYSGATDIDTLIKYTDAVNDKRRHMTSSQRAAFAAEANVLRLKQGNSEARSDGSAKTQAQRAKDLGTTDRQIRRAETVKEQVAPKVWEAVKAGKVPLDAAKQAIGLPEAKQNELAERALAGGKEMKAGKFSALARQEKKREVVHRINRAIVAPMPMGPFGLIVPDYPWKYRNSDGHEGSRGHTPYPPMEWKEILAHSEEAAKRAGDDSVLGLWIPNAFLLKAGDVLDAWGFVDMEAPITWDKVHVGMGIRGPRHQTEHLILATRGNPITTLNEMTTLFREPREVGGGHSKKPDRLYEELAKHCPGPRLELFAVGQREGWECWGAEADKPIATERKKKSKILTESDARAAQGAV